MFNTNSIFGMNKKVGNERKQSEEATNSVQLTIVILMLER